ncbi:MAG: aquaporin [Pseudomonadota bacterium]
MPDHTTKHSSRWMPYAAEATGTFALVFTVCSAGITTHFSQYAFSSGMASLITITMTAAMLWIIITAFENVSGSHFNPIFTLDEVHLGNISTRRAIGYITVQLLGAFTAIFYCHLLYNQNLIQPLLISRNSIQPISWCLGEFTGTLGLLLIFRYYPKHKAIAMALYISIGYWIMPSGLLGNPAATLSRVMTQTVGGIAFNHALLAIAAQLSAVILFIVFTTSRFKSYSFLNHDKRRLSTEDNITFVARKDYEDKVSKQLSVY